MKILLATLLCFGFTSCMHVGMMGVRDGHHAGTIHERTSDPVFEKEVSAGDVKAIATFPPLDVSNGATLTLKLVYVGTAIPISGAHVYFHAQYAHRVSHDNHGESPSPMQQRQHVSYVDRVVLESSETGVYTVPYGTSQPGEHTLMFHIIAIGERKLESEIVVGATRTISDERMPHKGGMMGRTNFTTYVIIGTAVMGAVMVAMLVGGGGMFR